MSYRRVIPVEFNHCDPAGIVFYPRYFEMVNSVVETFFADVAGYSFAAMMRDRHGVPTARIETDFKAPSRLGDKLDYDLTIARLGRTSMTFAVVAFGGDELRMQVALTVVFVDGTGRATAWPESVRSRIEAFQRGGTGMTTPHEILHPKNWKPTPGYSNGMAASGRMIFTGGMIGWNAAQEFESDDFVDQVATALRNIVAVLAEAGARPEHIVRLTWYVTDKAEYLARLRDLGRAYREVIGRHFPVMALVQVVALVEDRAKVEIEATAVLPDARAE